MQPVLNECLLNGYADEWVRVTDYNREGERELGAEGRAYDSVRENQAGRWGEARGWLGNTKEAERGKEGAGRVWGVVNSFHFISVHFGQIEQKLQTKRGSRA